MLPSFDVKLQEHEKQYEFNLFDRIISGDLNPYFLDNPKSFDFVSALKSKYDTCFICTIATFKTSKGKSSLIAKKSYNALHPEVNNLFNLQTSLFDPNDIDFLSKKAFDSLKLNRKNILTYSLVNSPGKTILYFKETSSFDTLSFSEAKYYYYSELLKSEVQKIKLSINSIVIKCTSKVETEHYIHKTQQAVVSLTMQLLKLISPANINDMYKEASSFNNLDILNLTFIHLEVLSLFFEKEFPKYIDVNIQISHRSTLIESYVSENTLAIVKARLLSANLSQPLLKAIFVPFIRIGLLTGPERITYKELIYFDTYLATFHNLIQAHENLSEDDIIKVLIELNFNSKAVLLLNCDRTLEKINVIESASDKIDFLYLELKTINQVHQRNQLCYNSSLPSLKTLISTWIEEEINYLTKKMAIHSQPPSLFNSALKNKLKIQTSLSVAQLAYFHKLLVDVGAITHSNQRDVIRFIADNYQTSKTKDISTDSISSKFYNIEPSTIDSTKDLIINLLNQVRSH
jgi:hypothetical protein